MKKVTQLTLLLVVGIILALGPVWGVMGTVLGMIMAFGQLGQATPAEPGVLAKDISLALYTTMAGYLACPIGLVLIIVATLKLCKNEKRDVRGHAF